MNNDDLRFQEFLKQLPEERREAIKKLRDTIKENLPEGFEEYYTDKILHFVVPFALYPSGYHANPKEQLPFISLASQKNYIGFYHMGLYSFPDILTWFQEEYPKHTRSKLDMGKSCVRFKNINDIPYDLIAELSKKITVGMWIEKYEELLKK